MKTKTEEFYIIEYAEPNSYVNELELSFSGQHVRTTVGCPFQAKKFNNKEHVSKIVDMLQYQGRNKARKSVRFLTIKAIYELQDD